MAHIFTRFWLTLADKWLTHSEGGGLIRGGGGLLEALRYFVSQYLNPPIGDGGTDWNMFALSSSSSYHHYHHHYQRHHGIINVLSIVCPISACTRARIQVAMRSTLPFRSSPHLIGWFYSFTLINPHPTSFSIPSLPTFIHRDLLTSFKIFYF